MDNIKKKRKNEDKPTCKYGLMCYQKSPEHHKNFSHPTATKNVGLKNVKRNTLKDVQKPTSKISKTKDSFEIGGTASVDVDKLQSGSNILSETVESILKSMPKDFFDFWTFCISLNETNPAEAFSEFGIQLVGVYDLLAQKLPSDEKIDISCHWRYYYDPPEFQTVIKVEGEDLYHIGYFRDDPSEMPSVLASNCAAVDGKLTLEGDNIFAAIISALDEAVKLTKSKALKNKAKKLEKDIDKFAAKNKYSIEVETTKTKQRGKKVVAKTFHGLGIVVPIKDDIGYRPLPDSNAKVKSILKKIVSCKDETKRLDLEEALDEICSNIHFANDECDFGMGLEFGIDLFCFGDPYLHQHISNILPLAYNLLRRPKFADVIKAHLKNRKTGSNLSTLFI